jgi:hypothetical protein
MCSPSVVAFCDPSIVASATTTAGDSIVVAAAAAVEAVACILNWVEDHDFK